MVAHPQAQNGFLQVCIVDTCTYIHLHCFPFVSNRCPAPEFCPCSKFTPTGENTGELRYRDYQEIKVQEHVQMLDIGTIPRSLWAVLEDDLVDGCKPGDDVTITLVEGEIGEFPCVIIILY